VWSGFGGDAQPVPGAQIVVRQRWEVAAGVMVSRTPSCTPIRM